MAPRVKALAAKPGDLSTLPGTHIVERDERMNRFSQYEREMYIHVMYIHIHTMYIHMHIYTIVVNKLLYRILTSKLCFKFSNFLK